MPHQQRWPSDARQVDQLDSRPGLHPRRRAARRAARPGQPRLDVHHHGVVAVVVDSERAHVRQADKQLAHARRVDVHRALRIGWLREPSDSRALVPRHGGPSDRPHTHLGPLSNWSVAAAVRDGRLLRVVVLFFVGVTLTGHRPLVILGDDMHVGTHTFSSMDALCARTPSAAPATSRRRHTPAACRDALEAVKSLQEARTWTVYHTANPSAE